MASKERAADRGARLARSNLGTIGTEIRTARMTAGLRLADVGRAVGLSYSQVGRIERGRHPHASLHHLSRICAVVGLDLSVRTYPGPAPIRDAAQIALIERLRERLHPSLPFRTEVPIPISGDQRAWDAVVGPDEDRTAVEAETRLYDIQAVLRKIALKRRDAGIERVILLLNATQRNRAAVREASAILMGSFPVSTKVALAALGRGAQPPGSAIIFL